MHTPRRKVQTLFSAIAISIVAACTGLCFLSAFGRVTRVHWQFGSLATYGGKVAFYGPEQSANDGKWFPTVHTSRGRGFDKQFVLGPSTPKYYPLYFGGPGVELPNWLFLPVVFLIAWIIGVLGRRIARSLIGTNENCRCGYCLRGNTSGVCPECGERVAGGLIRTRKTQPIRKKLIRSMILSNLAAIAIIASGIIIGITRAIVECGRVPGYFEYDPRMRLSGSELLLYFLIIIPNMLLQYMLIASAAGEIRPVPRTTRRIVVFYRRWKRVFFHGIPLVSIAMAGQLAGWAWPEQRFQLFVVPIWCSYLYLGAKLAIHHERVHRDVAGPSVREMTAS